MTELHSTKPVYIVELRYRCLDLPTVTVNQCIKLCVTVIIH